MKKMLMLIAALCAVPMRAKKLRSGIWPKKQDTMIISSIFC